MNDEGKSPGGGGDGQEQVEGVPSGRLSRSGWPGLALSRKSRWNPWRGIGPGFWTPPRLTRRHLLARFLSGRLNSELHGVNRIDAS